MLPLLGNNWMVTHCKVRKEASWRVTMTAIDVLSQNSSGTRKCSLTWRTPLDTGGGVVVSSHFSNGAAITASSPKLVKGDLPLHRSARVGRRNVRGLYLKAVMNPHIKRAAELILPRRIFVTIQSIRSRNYQKRLHKEWGIYTSTVEMMAEYGRVVLDGPFRGMKYPSGSLLNRHGIPIIFGTYELELHPIIEEVALKHYERIIDIGCAEGYYAVGLALRTGAEVYAFDCEPRERLYCRQMARENNVSVRVHVKSWCSRGTLKKLALGRCLIVSDCEGFEANLFSNAVIAMLKNSDLIIELHQIAGIDSRSVLVERFKASHNARLITFGGAVPGSTVPVRWRKFAREFRPPNQQWLYFTPRT